MPGTQPPQIRRPYPEDMSQPAESVVRGHWSTSSSPWASSAWFLIVFAVFALSAPVAGVPGMFAALLIFQRAYQILRRIGLVIAVTLTGYTALFVADQVQFIYWQ